MRVVITGSNGLLGQKIVQYCQSNSIEYFAISKGENRNSNCPESRYTELDITDRNQVFEVLNKLTPTHLIHTAAMTNVDQCETDKEGCELINVTATAYLLEASNSLNCHFQLLSTDFVFDGVKGNYVEDDIINPLSAYAKSKADAEKIVKERATCPWSIVRTIIVYGKAENLSKSNIILWAKTVLEKGDPLSIVDDQFRAPTWAEDLAAGCMAILEKQRTGVYHMSGPETMSIHELITRIARHFGYPTDHITKISSATLNQAAKRPPKTGFDLTKARTEVGYDPHTLEQTLDALFD